MEEVSDAFPAAFRQRQDDPYHFRPPGGENLQDMAERIAVFLDDVRASVEEEVALVTHQVMSRVILGRLLQLDPVATSRVVHPNELVYRVDFSDEKPHVTHYLGGDGPRDGLLQHSDDETIARLDTRDTDKRT